MSNKAPGLTLSEALAKITEHEATIAAHPAAITAAVNTAVTEATAPLTAKIAEHEATIAAHPAAITAAVEAAVAPLNAKVTSLEAKDQDIDKRATAIATQRMSNVGQPPVLASVKPEPTPNTANLSPVDRIEARLTAKFAK